jgi:cold shock CspA family protein
MPAPTCSFVHYSSVQEFQELQKQQQLLNGNAWAQQKGHMLTNFVSCLGYSIID